MKGPFHPGPRGRIRTGSSKLENGKPLLSFFPPCLYFLKGPEIWLVIISSYTTKNFKIKR
jgi:hypothetical protein